MTVCFVPVFRDESIRALAGGRDAVDWKFKLRFHQGPIREIMLIEPQTCPSSSATTPCTQPRQISKFAAGSSQADGVRGGIRLLCIRAMNLQFADSAHADTQADG